MENWFKLKLNPTEHMVYDYNDRKLCKISVCRHIPVISAHRNQSDGGYKTDIFTEGKEILKVRYLRKTKKCRVLDRFHKKQ